MSLQCIILRNANGRMKLSFNNTDIVVIDGSFMQQCCFKLVSLSHEFIFINNSREQLLLVSYSYIDKHK